MEKEWDQNGEDRKQGQQNKNQHGRDKIGKCYNEEGDERRNERQGE